MYYPYLRGLRFEMFALSELSIKIAKSKKIVPIIEPVNLNSTTLKSLTTFQKANMPFILVANPFAVKNSPTMDQIKAIAHDKVLTGYNCYKMGFVITPYTTLKEIEEFIKTFPKIDLCLIHYFSFTNSLALSSLISKTPRITTQVFISAKIKSKSYIKAVKNNTEIITIEDSFIKASKNELFPPEEFYSELHNQYVADGYDGFGDFSIVGEFKPGGGPAHAVAIHHVFKPAKSNDLWIKHFISDTNGTPDNPAGKFMEALTKLISFFSKVPTAHTTDGILEFKDLFKRAHFPGLGELKKISIKHHLELMDKIL